MFNFKENQFLELPILCISVYNDTLIFSTKKIGSRFFERDYINTPGENIENTINFQMSKISENSEHQHNGYEFREFRHKLKIDEFFKILNISSISELFSDRISQKYKFVFIVRNPMDRFYTGLFEKTDSVFSEIITDENNYSRQINDKYYTSFTQNVVKSYFNIDDDMSLKFRPQSTIDSILNTFSVSLDYTIFNDSHLSLWNTFLLDFINDIGISSNIDIIDLSDSEKINSIISETHQQPSNKKWITDWLENSNNKSYIDIMHNNLKYYLDLELESYQKLLNKK